MKKTRISFLADPERLEYLMTLTGAPKTALMNAALDILEKHLKAPHVEIKTVTIPFIESRAPYLGNKRYVAARLEADTLDRLSKRLNLSTTEVLTKALDLLAQQELFSHLPPLNQEELSQ